MSRWRHRKAIPLVLYSSRFSRRTTTTTTTATQGKTVARNPLYNQFSFYKFKIMKIWTTNEFRASRWTQFTFSCAEGRVCAQQRVVFHVHLYSRSNRVRHEPNHNLFLAQEVLFGAQAQAGWQLGRCACASDMEFLCNKTDTMELLYAYSILNTHAVWFQ